MKSPLRVLHVYKTYKPESFGGVEQMIWQLARSTGAAGWSSSVFCLGRKKEAYETEGHAVIRVRSDLEVASTPMSFAALRAFNGAAATADVVHYHYPWPFMDLLHAQCRVKKPAVVTYHSDVVRQKALLRLYRPLQRSFLGGVDAIVATSPNYVASSLELKPYAEKTWVIPIGLNPEDYVAPAVSHMDKWRQLLGNRFFLFVGVLRYYKGLDYLLEAAAGAAFPVVIAGAGPEAGKLEATVRQRGLRNVHLVGAITEEDKVALLALCTALVLPSHLRSEAFGIALLEAAMHGKPMISTELGTGTSYVNIHGQTGIVVPSADPMALRQAMERMWCSPDLEENWGAGAKSRFNSHFTAGAMARAYDRLYRQIMGRRQSGSPMG